MNSSTIAAVPDDPFDPGDVFALPVKGCIDCGHRVPANRRVKLSRGWICASCLESDAYARGQRAGQVGA